VLGKPLNFDVLDRKSGLPAWFILAFAVIVYDTYAIKSEKIETLTRSFWRITEKSKLGNIFTGVWLGLTFHLLIEKSVKKAYHDSRLAKINGGIV
jgi:hypothetical protein